MIFLAYPKCSTCKKAQKWLDDNNIKYELQHIVEDNPNIDQLKKIHKLSELPLKRLFNTSGILYREMDLKTKLETATQEEMFAILSSNGMLVKRPIVLGNNVSLIGFKEMDWTKKLL